MKAGDKVKDIHRGFVGTVVSVWSGRYFVDYYVGEQFNPYRIAVKFGQDYIEKFGGGLLGNGTILCRAECLEKL